MPTMNTSPKSKKLTPEEEYEAKLKWVKEDCRPSLTEAKVQAEQLFSLADPKDFAQAVAYILRVISDDEDFDNLEIAKVECDSLFGRDMGADPSVVFAVYEWMFLEE